MNDKKLLELTQQALHDREARIKELNSKTWELEKKNRELKEQIRELEDEDHCIGCIDCQGSEDYSTVADYIENSWADVSIRQAIMMEHRAEELSKANGCAVARTLDRGNGSQNVYCKGILGNALYYLLREGDENWERLIKGADKPEETWQTVTDYAKANDIVLDAEDIAELENLAMLISDDLGYKTTATRRKGLGNYRAYHTDVLDEAFGRLAPSELDGVFSYTKKRRTK